MPNREEKNGFLKLELYLIEPFVVAVDVFDTLDVFHLAASEFVCAVQ